MLPPPAPWKMFILRRRRLRDADSSLHGSPSSREELVRWLILSMLGAQTGPRRRPILSRHHRHHPGRRVVGLLAVLGFACVVA